jgi:hypothetical protein
MYYCTEHDASDVTRHKCRVRRDFIGVFAHSWVFDIEKIRHNQNLVRTIVLATVPYIDASHANCGTAYILHIKVSLYQVHTNHESTELPLRTAGIVQ